MCVCCLHVLAQVFKYADRKMHDRHFYDAYQKYQTMVSTSEEFVQAFPSSARGCALVGYLHARRAIALSCHGNDMGEESGRKWHAQVCVSTYLPLRLSCLYQGSCVCAPVMMLLPACPLHDGGAGLGGSQTKQDTGTSDA
jgi:hypothetical protein